LYDARHINFFTCGKLIIMTDVLIITAPFTYTFGPSLGPALLKSCVVSQGLSAQAWDLSAEFNYTHSTHEYYTTVTTWMASPEIQLSQQEFDWYRNIVKEYADRIVKINPKNIAISVLTQNSQRFTEDLCYYIKLGQQNIKILLGGSGLDIFQFQHQCAWHELMINSGLCDCAIIGEGESALGDAVKNNTVGVVRSTQLANAQLEEIPVPDYSDYNFDFYLRSKKSYWSSKRDIRSDDDQLIFLITASKGCVKSCNFCDVYKQWPRYRVRSGHSVANEIIELHKKYNARYFSFTDSLINGGLKPFLEMNSILEQQLPDTIFYEGQMICRSQRDMPEKYFKSMKSAGCHRVQIGMESGSEQVRMHMGKGSSTADVNYTTEMLIKYEIAQGWNIIAGYPTETEQDWKDTMDLVKFWHPRSDGLLTIIPIDTFQMLSGTKITQDPEMKISYETIHGYSDFAWVSDLNSQNTFPERVRRFVELCEFCISVESSQYLIDNLRKKIDTATIQLEWYKNAKQKKVFSIIAN
jgi:radical SAM superfamily enzyme YgiQ (UPF0313 family)